jgi:TldD protein
VNIRQMQGFLVLVLLSGAWALPAVAAEEQVPVSDVLMQALTDELGRALTLQMEDLEKPYFGEFDVRDAVDYQISAEYGALTSSERDRSRRFSCSLRVGSQELDNTNFSGDSSYYFGGYGVGRASLPLDDDYLALRQAIWRAADADYKEAVETLTKKRAYMKNKTIEDRPNDFSPAPVAEYHAPAVPLDFDRAQWEENLQALSARFCKYEQVQDSGVRLILSAGNKYTVNSDGTRVQDSRCRTLLTITANVQDDDGMRFSGHRSYVGASPADFPPLEQIQKDIDELVSELTTAMKAPVLERYTGPVLFDARPAAQLFQTLLADGVAGRPDPLGEGRRSPLERDSLEKKLGMTILPKSFDVWDDPTIERCEGKVLLGAYPYDDEGVAAQRVDLVAGGKLSDMCMSRAPIKKLSGSNGHGRRPASGGDVKANIGCLYVKDDDGVPEAQLKEALIEAARDAGLEFGVRIKSLKQLTSVSDRREMMTMIMGLARGGGRSLVTDPVLAYKVYVKDGHEEPFRVGQFGRFDVRDLKHILAAGDKLHASNFLGVSLSGATPPASIICPAVLFEELELSKNDQEQDKPPLLKAPAFR